MSEASKSEKKWTLTQSETIDYKGHSLLLSAGAGSGKTATLTERVARLVCDEEAGVPISRMLIVTFTVAAAKELKDRIGKKIGEELEKNPSSPHLIRQAIELESAPISTISSFFYRAVRPFASHLSLPPDFRVAQSAVTDVMKKRIMSEVTDDFFDSGNEDFIVFADALSTSKDENSLSDVLLDLADTLTSKGADADTVGKWAAELDETGGEDFFKTPHGRVIKEDTAGLCDYYHHVFCSLRTLLEEDADVEKAYGKCCDTLICDTEALARLVSESGYASAREAICSFENPKLGSLKEDKKTPASRCFASMKKEFFDRIKKLREQVYRCDKELLEKTCYDTARICRTVASVLGEFYTRFEGEKKEKGIVDFSDLEIYAKRIFCDENGEPTQAALDFSKQYDYIFIDEYQDTNETQDAVFRAISVGMKRFMVGDVKQSIYAFRGADPAVFNSYREKWPPFDEIKAVGVPDENTEATFFMNENFRSDKNVIDFVNLVSEYMFPGSDTPFEDGDRLVFSRLQPEGYKDSRSEICLLLSGESEKEKKAVEYDYVAERIAAMIKNERRGDGTPYEMQDFAILLRSASRADKFADALGKRGIAVKDRATDEFFEQPEILLALSILNAIDNPLRDIYLAGAMKSPVFGFTVDDMLKIRLGKTDIPLWYCVDEYISDGEDPALIGKCADFSDFVSDFRSRARRMGADTLLSAVYEKLSLMSLRESEDDSPQTRARIRRNLISLYEHARQYEKNSFSGLGGFISYLGELMDSRLEAESQVSSENAVTITTIHKSKGLEFPVCFLCESTKKFSDKDTKQNLLTEPSVGMAMSLRDDSGLVKCATPLRFAVARQIGKASVYEEMRILYVAMTRASERLIVCAEESANGENGDLRALFERSKLTARFATPFSKLCAKSYISWILPCAARALENEAAPCFDIKYVSKSDVGFTELPAAESRSVELPDEDNTALYRSRFEFEYPYAYLKNIPAKLTVSKLKPDSLDTDDELLSVESYAERLEENDPPSQRGARFSSEYIPDEERSAEKPPLPAFLSESEEKDSAFAGTATHVFLQFCDFERLCECGFDSELERLLEKDFITKQMAESVSREHIEAFANSRLLREISSSPFVKREFRFNVALPAADFTTNEKSARLLAENDCRIIVQGVCDLVFENGDGELVLIDYKTDRLTDFEIKNPRFAEKKLRERHSKQLMYYKCALEKIFARRVSKAAVYSLPLGDTVDIV